MGKTIAARNACIRAAITQCPTAVDNAIRPTQTHSIIKLTRPEAWRRKINVTSSSNAMRKPAILITESERVTMPPAISLAFARSNDLNTPKAAGATTAPKKSAAPNQQASRIIREKFRVFDPFLIKLVNEREQPDLW